MKGMKKPVTATGSLLAGAALAALFAVSANADSKYLIDADVWSAYQRYADAIGSTRPGAFAITEDGSDFWYVKCRYVRCSGSTTYRHDAEQACEKEFGKPCVIFALRREIMVEYEVRN